MNQKFNKGITLIALVITIIVLLILAGVTISMVLGDDGIIAQAQQAKQAQEKGEGKDYGEISSVEGVISQYSMSKYDDTNKPIAKQNSTLNGEKASSTNPVIPKGFKHLLGTVDEGFVIQDELGNEFVWVPVNGTTVKLELDSDFGSRGREPDLVTGKTTTEDGKTISDLNGTNYDMLEANRKAILEDEYENTIEGLKKQFTDEYNAMVKSVETYGGFYVGRYETGWDETKGVVVCKPGIPMTGETLLDSSWTTSNVSAGNKATWYGLYDKQKELYKKNSSSSVVSGMIYGCQWDAIMNWMLNSEDEDVRTFVTDSTGMGWISGASGNSTHETGKDLNGGMNKVNNIYDLAGNYWEWTQEASKTSSRMRRGAWYGYAVGSYPAYECDDWYDVYYPTSATPNSATRLQLYIK